MAEVKRPKGLDSRRGYAMLLTAGDPEISGALAEGIMAARVPTANSLSQATPDNSLKLPQSGLRPASSLGEGALTGGLTAEQVQVVEAEIDRQKIADLMRVAMHREPVNYAQRAFDAEVEYGESLYERGPLERLGEKLLVVYALVVMAFERLFESVGG